MTASRYSGMPSTGATTGKVARALERSQASASGLGEEQERPGGGREGNGGRGRRGGMHERSERLEGRRRQATRTQCKAAESYACTLLRAQYGRGGEGGQGGESDDGERSE